MPRLWRLMSYVTSGGREVVGDWFEAQPEAVQAAFLVRLEYLLACPRPEWKRESFDLLSGPCRGLAEIRFKANKVQHRPVGFFGPDRAAFTILICAEERGGRFVPKSTCDIAQKRRSEIIADAGRAIECKWLWDDDEGDDS